MAASQTRYKKTPNPPILSKEYKSIQQKIRATKIELDEKEIICRKLMNDLKSLSLKNEAADEPT